MAGNDRRLVVNVGGIRYTTSVTTLLSEQNSFITGMLGGDWAELTSKSFSPSFVELSKLLAKDWQILQVVGYGRGLQLQVLLVSSKL